jgi:hypothetical protein
MAKPDLTNVVKFPLQSRMPDHPYLNGFGWTERHEELERVDRRLGNTIAGLQRRRRAVVRLIRLELRRIDRERLDWRAQ